MSPSFKRLKIRSHQLRMALLPRRFSRIGNYAVEVRDRAAAFRIMLCAELETYFETMAADILDDAQAAWKTNRTLNRALACAIGACKEGPAIPSKIDEIHDDKPYLSELVRKACGIHRQTIQNNRGTKDLNILRMFVPLGLDETQIEVELLADCNAITAQRGDVAHNTIDHTKILVDPRTEYDRYHSLLERLKSFDALAEPLKSVSPAITIAASSAPAP